jgi:phosphoribosylanthranilate isomerase
MIGDIRLKVCGVTNEADAKSAADAGADFIGYNLYPKSPRYLALESFQRLARHPAHVRLVAVTVEPTLAELAAMNAAGFDFFQVHFRPDLPASTVASWAETVGVERLWLAPKLPPAVDVPVEMLPPAGTFLLDTFDADKFGGTGRTGDWGKFARHQKAHPHKTWILSGGLSPANISAAIHQSGARFVDVNSGVESAPGVKDHAKLGALVKTILAR